VDLKAYIHTWRSALVEKAARLSWEDWTRCGTHSGGSDEATPDGMQHGLVSYRYWYHVCIKTVCNLVMLNTFPDSSMLFPSLPSPDLPLCKPSAPTPAG
jgi:hypothetical protein